MKLGISWFTTLTSRRGKSSVKKDWMWWIKVFNTPEHHSLSLQAEREAIVLLKNEKNTLPLRKDLKAVAVIGAKADVAQLGNYSRPGNGKVSILAGIRKAVSPSTKVVYEKGADRSPLPVAL